MQLLRTKNDLRRRVRSAQREGLSIGLVPTMGALHDGHLSLVARARDENDLVIMSVFVNPTQFGPAEDFVQYPRDLDRDLGLAADAGVDVVFHPTPEEMYAPGHCTWVEVEGLSEGREGAARPGHFRGVATVVTKLFSLCSPNRAYFGQKDAQQVAVVRRLNLDLDLGVEVVECPIVREPDGLALSSRNVYLSPAERAEAPALHRALLAAEAAVAAGGRDMGAIQAEVWRVLAEAPSGEVEYVDVVDPEDLLPLAALADGDAALLLLAVRFGTARLLDNVLLRTPGARGR